MYTLSRHDALPIYGVDSQDKGAGKATTYALKYALLYSFLVPTGDIDDTDIVHSQEYSVKPNKPQVKSESLEKSAISDDVLNAILNNIQYIKGLEDYYKIINLSFKLNPDQIELFSNRKKKLNK
jgi:hypothetical protein